MANTDTQKLFDAVNRNDLKSVQTILESSKIDINAQNDEGRSAFLIACTDGYIEIAKYLADKGANIHVKDDYGFSALNHAAAKGFRAIAEFLVEKGANLNEIGWNKMTPFFQAFNNEYYEIASYLAKKGADVHAKNEDGLTLLHLAVENGCLNDVEFLIDNCGCDVNVKDNDGYTPIFKAIRSKNASLIEHLIERGANLNAVNNYGLTVLEEAVIEENAEIIGLLLKKGANVNQIDTNGDTVMHRAVKSENRNLINLFLLHGVDLRIKPSDLLADFMKFCIKSDMPLIKELIKNGADVNYMSHTSVLENACANAPIEIVRFLLESGADPNENTHAPWSALNQACRRNDLEMVKLLVKHGADVKKCVGIVHAACKSNNIDILKYVVEQGADVNARCEDEEHPLTAACSYASLEMVKYLFENGSKIEPCALFLIKDQWNNFENMKFLIENGADLNEKSPTDDNTTLIHYACSYTNFPLVKLLVQKGVDVNQKDNFDFTPLYYAKFNRFQEMVDYLIAHGAEDVQINEVARLDDPLEKLTRSVENDEVEDVAIKMGDLELQIPTFKSLLYTALERKHEAITEFLLKRMLEQTKSKEIELKLACIRNDLDKVKALVDSGAKALFCPEAIEGGFSVLKLAFTFGREKIAKFICEKYNINYELRKEVEEIFKPEWTHYHPDVMKPIDDQDMYKIAFNIKNELDYKNSSNIIRNVLKEKKWPQNPQWDRYNYSVS